MTTKPLNLFLLVDRTGSMSGIWQQTISTINEFVGSLKDQDVRINLAFFDRAWNSFGNNIETPILQIRYVAAKEWKPLSADDISIAPRGTTPLYDAVCDYAEQVKAQGLKKKDLVQFVVITDGDENCSRRHSYADTKNILAKYEKKGWSVLFLGANLEATKGGEKIVADMGKLGQYNPQNWMATAAVMNNSTMRYMNTHDVSASAFTDAERTALLNTN